MNGSDLIAWSLVDQFLSSSTLWGSNSFVAKADRLLGWAPDDLDLSPTDDDDPALLRQRVRRWADLSRLADVIPTSKRLAMDGPILSRLVRQILSEGECATGVILSDTEKNKLARARSVLFETGPDGSVQSSSKSKSYSLYKSRYYAAEQALRTADLQVESSGDVSLVQHFHDTERAELVETINTARLEWIELGYKNEVEEATALQLAYAERAPIEAWTKFRQRFSTAEIKDLSGWGFYPIRTIPDNSADLTWQSATVHTPINKKYSDTPLGLIAGEAKADFDRVEFEYAFLRIDRGWLDSSSSVLNSRIWRHPDYPKGSISDGKSPPNGICPGFAVGFILVRSLKVFSTYTTKTTSEGNEVKIPSDFNEFIQNQNTIHPLNLKGTGHHELVGDLKVGAIQDLNVLFQTKNFAGDTFDKVHLNAPTGHIPVEHKEFEINSNLQPPKKTISFDDRVWDAKSFLKRPNVDLTPIPDVDQPMDASLEDLIARLKAQRVGSKPTLNPIKANLNFTVTTAESTRALLAPNRLVLGGIVCKSLPIAPDPDPGMTWV